MQAKYDEMFGAKEEAVQELKVKKPRKKAVAKKKEDRGKTAAKKPIVKKQVTKTATAKKKPETNKSLVKATKPKPKASAKKVVKNTGAKTKAVKRSSSK